METELQQQKYTNRPAQERENKVKTKVENIEKMVLVKIQDVQI